MRSLSLLVKPVSGLCQYRCAYCFYQDVMAHRENAMTGIMSEETLETMVRRAMACAEGSVTFAFQGGEPTLAGLDFFQKLMEMEKRYKKSTLYVSNSIQTNGGNIDDEWAEFLAQNHFLVGLSMDGYADLHDKYRVDAAGKGTFSRAVQAAETMKRHGVDFNALCVVNSESAAHPEEVYEALRPYRFIQFIPCIDDFDSKEARFAPSAEALGQFLIRTFDLYRRDILAGEYTSVRIFDNYLQMLIGHRPEICAMNGRCSCSLVIEADGSAYPCDFYVLDSWKLGNVLTHSFTELQNSDRAKEFIASSAYMDPACRKCAHYSMCRGGCRRDREPFDGFGRPALNKYCEGYRAFFEARGKQLRELAQTIMTMEIGREGKK